MKKILSLVLAMLMIISMVPAVFAAETSESDYQAAINYLKAIGLYKGTTDGDAADELVERYQMALFTARTVTGRVDNAYWETDTNDSGFTDLEGLNAEALGGVCYAAQQGIVNGIGGNEFAPFDNVTYRDAIVMIVRALGFNYPDSGYPWSYINKARELGVLDGITGVSYTVEVKREVIAQLLYNAINAEIKGETIAASVFGVEETIVMVTATSALVYGANASVSLKSSMVKVSAIDVEGEPVGAEYYVPYSELGCRNLEQANKLVGTNFKLTHRNNFSEFLAVESLSKVFENTPSKEEVAYAINDGKLTLGGKSYAVINGDYADILNNNQGTVKGNDEIKIYKAYGATGIVTGATQYVLAADGNIYDINNPFVPYAVYSALVNKWFQVVTDNIVTTPDIDLNAGNINIVTSQNKTYKMLTDSEVNALLAKTTTQVAGFARMQTSTAALYSQWAPKIHNSYGETYDYYEMIASDIDGDGDYDRAVARPYELLRITKWNETKKVDGSWTSVALFNAKSFQKAVNQPASVGLFNEKTDVLYGDQTYTAVNYTGRADEGVDLYRFTGIKLDKVPNGAFVVAYISRDGIGAEKEIDIVEVVGGAQEDAEDQSYMFQTYIRGYDSVTNSVIYGANYDTIPFGTYAVKNSTAHEPAKAYSSNQAYYVSSTAAYVQSFWNKYVNVYVLNGRVIYIEDASAANDYVILESFTDFTEDGLKAMAYSTKAGGYAEITIGELNGWNLGGYDYELFMMLKKMADLGLTVKDYPLPVSLNKIYAVRYVDETGAYNLVDAGAGKVDSLYVNNFGYILGIDQYGWNDAGRVPTTDKDLWIIQTQKYLTDAQGNYVLDANQEKIVVADKVVMFKGKLSAIELQNFTFYKAIDNQYVAIAPVGAQLGPILGNTTEGLDYWLYNQFIDNYYNKNYFTGFNYGHYMTNVRTGAVEFVTYDSELAKALFANNPTLPNNYIVLTEGAIYPATNKVLKDATYTYGPNNALVSVVVNAATMKNVADLQYASTRYYAYDTVAVGAVLPAGLDVDAAIAQGVLTTDIAGAYNNYEALRDAIALNLYAGVYGNDFTNDPTGTDVYAQIKKELLANVTFVNRTAAGTHEMWVGYKASNDTWPAPSAALGSATAYAKAYVMYDYANASAKVFIDNMAQVELANAVIVTKGTAAVTGGAQNETAVVTYSYNLLKDTTIVTVEFAAHTTATITVGNQTISFLGSEATVEVAGNINTVTIAVAAVDTANWTKITSGLSLATDIAVANTDTTDGMAGMKLNGNCKNASSVLFDGAYTVSDSPNAWKQDTYVMQVEAFEKKVAADLSEVVANPRNGLTYLQHTDKALTDGYWGVAFIELAEAQDLAGFRLVAATDYTGASSTPYNQLVQGFDVLVSKDGGLTWTVATSVKDAVVKNLWNVVEATDTVKAYAYIDVPVVEADVTHVAFAITQVSNHPSDANNRIFVMAAEIELYK